MPHILDQARELDPSDAESNFVKANLGSYLVSYLTGWTKEIQ